MNAISAQAAFCEKVDRLREPGSVSCPLGLGGSSSAFLASLGQCGSLCWRHLADREVELGFSLYSVWQADWSRDSELTLCGFLSALSVLLNSGFLHLSTSRSFIADRHGSQAPWALEFCGSMAVVSSAPRCSDWSVPDSWGAPPRHAQPLSYLGLQCGRVPNSCIGGSGTATFYIDDLAAPSTVIAEASVSSTILPVGINCALIFGCIPSVFSWPPSLGFRPGGSHKVWRGFGAGCLTGTSVARGYRPSKHGPHPAHVSYMRRRPVARPVQPSAAGSYIFGLTLLLDIGSVLIPLARSLYGCFLLVLLRLLFISWRSSTPLGRLCGLPLLGVRLHPVHAMGFASPRHAVLSWHPWKDRKGRYGKWHASPDRLHLPSGRVARACLWLLCFVALPQPLSAGPVTLLHACWTLPIATAMTRPAGVPAGHLQPLRPRRPHEISPDELVSLTGAGHGSLPWDLHPQGRPPHPRLCTDPLPWPDPVSDTDAHADWVGVYIYTPHYRTVVCAVRLEPHEDLQLLMDVLVAEHPGVPAGLFDSIVPLLPQRHSGYASFVRFASVIRHSGTDDGFVAVVMDLTRVGGRYFATVLPRFTSVEALTAFALPLTSEDDRPLQYYVGCNARPWPSSAVVDLHDGDVITAFRGEAPSVARHWFEALRGPHGIRAPLHHFPRPEAPEAVCVLYQDARFVVESWHHYGLTTVEYIAQRLRLPPECTVMCTFASDDLDVQGASCPFVVCVQHLGSAPLSQEERAASRDIFVFCDFRPVGHKPRMLYTNYPALHIPSIASRFGIVLPGAYRLGVVGGRRKGDDLRIDGCVSLLFFAEEAPDLPDMSSDGSYSSEVSADALASPVDTDMIDAATPGSAPRGRTDSEAVQGSGTGSDAYGGTASYPASASTGDTAASTVQVLSLIFAPDFVPEIIVSGYALPCGAAQFIALLQSFRSEEQHARFPGLIPAQPQPSHDLAVFLAVPDWPMQRRLVLFDCRRCNHSMFAAVVFPRMNRESLLLAAGLPADAEASVYVHGLLQALSRAQIITIVTGMTVTIVPAEAGAPATYDLPARLLTRDGWCADAQLPGVNYHPGSHFHVLTDGLPTTFEVVTGRREHLRRDLATHLRCSTHAFALFASKPRLQDLYPRGVLVSGLLVLTQQLSGLPCPPARRPEHQIALILDAR